MAADSDCVFCKIVQRKLPASLVAEDPVALAFLDIRPINPGHTLVIPKAHASRLEDLSPASGGRLFEMAQAVASGLRRSGMPCEGVNIPLADGEAAGQEVFHAHLHVFPRHRGDGVGLRFGPGYGHVPARDELDAIAARIRGALSSGPSA